MATQSYDVKNPFQIPDEYRLQDVKGDGHCLFYTISVEVNGYQNNHCFYRQKAVEQLATCLMNYTSWVIHLDDLPADQETWYEINWLGAHLEKIANYEPI